MAIRHITIYCALARTEKTQQAMHSRYGNARDQLVAEIVNNQPNLNNVELSSIDSCIERSLGCIHSSRDIERNGDIIDTHIMDFDQVYCPKIHTITSSVAAKGRPTSAIAVRIDRVIGEPQKTKRKR